MENNSIIPIAGFSKGQLEWGDFDRDGDLDLLLFAEYSSTNTSVKLMRNDGTVFTEISSGLPNYLRAKLKWTDYDLDGYLDIIISGFQDIFATEPVIKVFRNETNGTFSDQTPATLLGVSLNSEFKLVDLDNDGDEDLYLPGNFTSESSTVYFNNTGSFVEVTIGLIAYDGNSSWADYNKDGFMDVAIASSATGKVMLYNGKGDGVFEEIELAITGSTKGKIQWIDFDADGDLDLSIMGTSNGSPSFKLLRNSNGNFTTVSGIANLDEGDFEWADFNNDGYVDLLVSGRDQSDVVKTSLYINSNGNSFSFTGAIFTAVGDSNVEFIDFDQDGDADIIVSGKDASSTNIFKVYINRLVEDGGIGNNPPSSPTNLTTTLDNEIRLSWTAGTDDHLASQALSYNVFIQKGSTLITSTNALASGKLITTTNGNAYQNNFYIIKDLPPGDYTWTVQAIDDGYKGSAFATTKTFSVPNGPYGLTYSNPYYSTIQLSWQDTLSAETGFIVFRRKTNGAYQSVATLAANTTTYTDSEVDAGEYQYMVKASYGSYLSPASNELDVTVSMFIQQPLASLDAFQSPGIVWGDIDNDNDLDIIATGNNGATTGSAAMYLNSGNFIFTSGQVTGTQLHYENHIVRDFDSDGVVDLVTVKGASSMDIQFYSNTAGTFTSAGQILLAASEIIDVKDFDFDNNGSIDLLVQFIKGGKTYYKIYKNKGSYLFEESPIDITLHETLSGKAILGDYDLDGFIDVLMTGTDDSSRGLLQNINGDAFVLSNISLPPLTDQLNWFDFDSDGDMDLLLTSAEEILLYQNTNSTFIATTSLDISPNMNGDEVRYHFFDFNNDGRTDIFLASSHPILFQNKGNGMFERHGDIFPALEGFNNFQSYHVSDWDKDGDIDIIFCGLQNFNTKKNIVYKNLTRSGGQGPINQPPAVPSNLSVAVGKQIELSWNKSIDDLSSLSEVSYNVEVQKQGTIVRPGEANTTGLFRKILGKGNNGFTNLSSFTPWNAGNYNFRVQSLDASETPSAYSGWKAFYIPYGPHNLAGNHNLFNEVALTWQDTLSSVDYFTLERRKLDEAYQEIATIQSDTHSFIDLLSDYNQTYYYRIRAVRNTTPSAYSNEIKINTNRPLPPIAKDTTVYTCSGPNFVLSALGQNIKWYDNTALSSPIHSGSDYSVSVTDDKTFYLTQQVGGNVSYVAAMHITVEAKPPAPTTANLTYCEEEVIPAITVDGNQIKWYSDSELTQLLVASNVYQPINNGSDQTFYVTQTFGTCESPAEEVNIDIVEINAVLDQQNEILKVSHENADSYYWFLNGTLSTITYGINYITLTEVGNYTVQIFDGNCNETSASLRVDVITDTEDYLKEFISLYPNPSPGEFTISGLSKFAGRSVGISLIDRNGKVLHSHPSFVITQDELKFSRVLSAGVYIVQIDSEEAVVRKKLMIIN